MLLVLQNGQNGRGRQLLIASILLLPALLAAEDKFNIEAQVALVEEKLLNGGHASLKDSVMAMAGDPSRLNYEDGALRYSCAALLSDFVNTHYNAFSISPKAEGATRLPTPSWNSSHGAQPNWQKIVQGTRDGQLWYDVVTLMGAIYSEQVPSGPIKMAPIPGSKNGTTNAEPVKYVLNPFVKAAVARELAERTSSLRSSLSRIYGLKGRPDRDLVIMRAYYEIQSRPASVVCLKKLLDPTDVSAAQLKLNAAWAKREIQLQKSRWPKSVIWRNAHLMLPD